MSLDQAFKGFAMSPSHSTRKEKRCRYYLSQAYIQRKKEEAGSLPQIPAQDIEDFILQKIIIFAESVKIELSQ